MASSQAVRSRPPIEKAGFTTSARLGAGREPPPAALVPKPCASLATLAGRIWLRPQRLRFFLLFDQGTAAR